MLILVQFKFFLFLYKIALNSNEKNCERLFVMTQILKNFYEFFYKGKLILNL